MHVHCHCTLYKIILLKSMRWNVGNENEGVGGRGVYTLERLFHVKFNIKTFHFSPRISVECEKCSVWEKIKGLELEILKPDQLIARFSGYYHIKNGNLRYTHKPQTMIFTFLISIFNWIDGDFIVFIPIVGRLNLLSSLLRFRRI